MIIKNKPHLLNPVGDSEVVRIDWQTVHEAVKGISEHVQKASPDSIVVMVRGGMVPATMVSHQTGIRRLHFFQARRTASDLKHDYCDLSVLNHPHIPLGERVAIIEDIIFEGKTTYKCIELLNSQGVKVVTVGSVVLVESFPLLHIRDDASIPLFSPYCCKEETWIRFPWELPIEGER